MAGGREEPTCFSTSAEEACRQILDARTRCFGLLPKGLKRVANDCLHSRGPWRTLGSRPQDGTLGTTVFQVRDSSGCWHVSWSLPSRCFAAHKRAAATRSFKFRAPAPMGIFGPLTLESQSCALHHKPYVLSFDASKHQTLTCILSLNPLTLDRKEPQDEMASLKHMQAVHVFATAARVYWIYSLKFSDIPRTNWLPAVCRHLETQTVNVVP